MLAHWYTLLLLESEGEEPAEEAIPAHGGGGDDGDDGDDSKRKRTRPAVYPWHVPPTKKDTPVPDLVPVEAEEKIVDEVVAKHAPIDAKYSEAMLAEQMRALVEAAELAEAALSAQRLFEMIEAKRLALMDEDAAIAESVAAAMFQRRALIAEEEANAARFVVAMFQRMKSPIP